MKILIFGGTGEARELANELVGLGHDVTSSLAGRTLVPLLPKGTIRTGGFGDVENLIDFINAEKFDWLVDATHPFARVMSTKLLDAAEVTQLEFVRLVRPAWAPPPNANWQDVSDIHVALSLLPDDAVPFFGLGHKDIGTISKWPKYTCVVRLIEPAKINLPKNVHVILDRPPYSLSQEMALFERHSITHLVTKNSGGDQTRAKIDAAAARGMPIIVIRRPELPVAREVSSAQDVLRLVQAWTPGA